MSAEQNEPQQSEGQVSEVQRMDDDDATTAASPEDTTAGYPTGESGDPDTQGAGPDAAPPENRRDNEMKPSQRKRLTEGVEDE